MSLLSKNHLFNSAATITGIVCLLFVMANYKYNNFLLTNVNMIYITSLILGLVVTYMVYSYKTPNIAQLPIIVSTPPKTTDEVDIELIRKYSNIYQLVFEILTLDAMIADNRKDAFKVKDKAGNIIPATIENIRANMNMIVISSSAHTSNLDDAAKKQIENKLEKFPQLINTIKGALDKNIIVALQLIYDLDTSDSPFSIQVLNRAESQAIQNLSTLKLSDIKPEEDDKYFVTDVYTRDYEFLGNKLNELDDALSELLGKQRQHEYEIIADSIQVGQYLLGIGVSVSGSGAGKKNFKDLVSQVFKSDNTVGIYRFMDTLFDIITEIKDA